MTDILDQTSDSSGVGDVRILLRVVEGLPELHQRVLKVLSIAYGIGRAEFDELWGALPAFGEAPPVEAVSAVTALPIVESLGGRLRVSPTLGVELARGLASSEPELFDQVHEALATVERERERELEAADPHGEMLWQTKALVAYYLLRNSPSVASSKFIESFDDVPVNDRRTCRLWLADLSDRYTRISGEATRVGRFFRAFRLYVAAMKDEAESEFRSLVEEDASDSIAAISEHLVAIILPWDHADRRRLLEASVELSEGLGLSENLIMSRNSLVFQSLRESLSGDDVPARLQEARELAVANDLHAASVGIPVYLTATKYARAVAETELASRVSGDLAEKDVMIERILDQGESNAIAAHDVGSWLRSRLARVDLLVRLERPEDALRSLSHGVETIERAEAIPELPRRQFERQAEIVQSRFAPGSAESDEIDQLDRRFRRALRRHR